ncbi:hypothetical protein [Prochlorococcus sp. MIT 0604]|uniref:hypothetical protein n=1 Tax=Prochlorococcus sp. MIT 0604 TaxID=1501268 RepID=UPI0004F64F19|nr:hypothetical protein [Prochlorococcus sp. MIT 0604]AIQ94069.1 hypothetical protein EW14_0041 [Prochlorococcus sp. MIT 0604]
MKHFLFLFFSFGFISSVKADSLCTLTSEVEPDVTITLKYTGSGGGIGTLNYKNQPSLGFYVGIWNGYGGQYYTARSYSPELLKEEKTYQERTKNTKEIRTGPFINFVGNQLGRATSKEDRKSGKLRALMPSLAQGYYYSIPFTEQGQYGRQQLSKEMKTIIDATEGFFVNSGGCRKFFPYGWD